MANVSGQGFGWNDLGWKAYVLLVDPRPWFPEGKVVLEALPWIVPGIAGLVGFGAIGSRRERWAIALLLALIFPISTAMLTFADLQPPGLWYYCNIHYFKWIMPAFGVGVLLCWRLLQTRRGRLVLVPLMAGLVLPLGIACQIDTALSPLIQAIGRARAGRARRGVPSLTRPTTVEHRVRFPVTFVAVRSNRTP